MSVKTYWRAQDNGAWEFLGAWPVDHEPDPENGFVYGSALIHEDVVDVGELLKRMKKRTILGASPASIRKHLMTERESAIPFSMIEGFLK
jgi:hypothetical protein